MYKKIGSRILLWGIPSLITLGVVHLAYLMITPQFENCWNEWTAWPTPMEQVLRSIRPPSTCLSLNELGDFLAGSFAPVAFIWLAFAVVLQSRELAAQRDEIRLSREIAEESKLAIRAQAEEARRSADYFHTQTTLMQAQKDREEREEADKELPGLCDQIVKASERMHPPINIGSKGHDYDRVKKIIEQMHGIGFNIHDPAIRNEGGQMAQLLLRLSYLWPLISESNRLHLGHVATGLFLAASPPRDV